MFRLGGLTGLTGQSLVQYEFMDGILQSHISTNLQHCSEAGDMSGQQSPHHEEQRSFDRHTTINTTEMVYNCSC